MGVYVHPHIITVGCVLERVHDTKQTAVTDQELHQARSKTGDATIWAVEETYLRRDPDGRERAKHVDFLVGKTRFSGPELLDPELNRWRFYVRT